MSTLPLYSPCSRRRPEMQISSLANEVCTTPLKTCLSAQGRVGWDRRTCPTGPYTAIAISLYFSAKLPFQRRPQDRYFIMMDSQRGHSALCVLPSKATEESSAHGVHVALMQKTPWTTMGCREEMEKPQTLLVSLAFKTETNMKIPLRCHNISRCRGNQFNSSCSSKLEKYSFLTPVLVDA